MSKFLAKKYLEGSHSTKAIYGIILITAALIGFQFHESQPVTIAVKVFLAGFVIVLAEVYSEFLGERIRRKKELTRAERREIVGDALIISSVASYPVVIFLLSALSLYSTEIAFDISYVLSIVGLGVFGFLSSQAAGDSRSASARSALLTAFVGVIVVLIKYAFGH